MRASQCFGWAAVLAAGLFSLAASAYAQDLVGAEACGSCHEAQYKAWRRSAHSMSLARLTKIQRRDRVCQSCHTMDPGNDDPRFQGVQCESCHGPGQHYSADYVMRDQTLAKLLGLEPVQESTCSPCHTADGPGMKPFEFEDKVGEVCHVESKEEATPEKGASLAPGQGPAQYQSAPAPQSESAQSAPPPTPESTRG
jgi:hypothetical protein